jgi:hypothetical protein
VARFRFDHPGRSPNPVHCSVPSGRAHHAESARRRWPPVAAAPRGLAPLTPALDIAYEVAHHSAPPSHCSAPPPRCSAPPQPPLCLSSPTASELSDRTKGSASSQRPSCTKSLPTAPSSEARQRDSPAVVFLHEHLISGSLLQLFPYPADPAVSSTLPRSSSSTTSLATSTTPSAPYRHLLPVGLLTVVEAPPPVRTPFPASPPRFSYSSM